MPFNYLLLQKARFIFLSGLTPTQTFCALILLLQSAKSQNWKLRLGNMAFMSTPIGK